MGKKKKFKKMEKAFLNYDRVESALVEAVAASAAVPPNEIIRYGADKILDAGKVIFYQIGIDLKNLEFPFDRVHLQDRIQSKIDYAQEYEGKVFYTEPYAYDEEDSSKVLLRTLRLFSIAYPFPQVAIFRLYVVDKDSFDFYLSENLDNIALTIEDLEWGY